MSDHRLTWNGCSESVLSCQVCAGGVVGGWISDPVADCPWSLGAGSFWVILGAAGAG